MESVINKVVGLLQEYSNVTGIHATGPIKKKKGLNFHFQFSSQMLIICPLSGPVF